MAKIPKVGGRCTSPARPGLFIHKYLMDEGEGSVSDMHRAYKEFIDIQVNQNRERKDWIRKPTYENFYKYFRHFSRLGLVVVTGEKPVELMANPENLCFVDECDTIVQGARQRVWSLTATGQAEVLAWGDPLKALGYGKR